MSKTTDLRESLFEAEPLSAERREGFRKEIADILEPRLPRSHRLYYQFAVISSIIGTFGAVSGLLFDRSHRGMWGACLLGLAASAGWYIHILRRGAEPIRTMQTMSKAMAGVGTLVAVCVIVCFLRNPSLSGVLWSLLGLLFCSFANVINLWNRMLIGERSTKEQILRVEYRLADLASRLGSTEMPAKRSD